MERSGARVPQDVDIEDRLIYGLSPHRFGYLVGLGLAAFAVWSGVWEPWPARGTLAASLLGMGAAMAWGRISGRALDLWVVDLARFLVTNHRLHFERPLQPRTPFRRRAGPPMRIDITSTEDGAGLTRIGIELASAMARSGAKVALTELGPGAADPGLQLGLLEPGLDPATGLLLDAEADSEQVDCLICLVPPGSQGKAPDVVLLTSSAKPDLPGPTWARDRGLHRVVNRADQSCSQPLAAHVIPDDPAFRLAAEARVSAVATSPRAGASRAIMRMACELLENRETS